jgi:hypothetical protein
LLSENENYHSNAWTGARDRWLHSRSRPVECSGASWPGCTLSDGSVEAEYRSKCVVHRAHLGPGKATGEFTEPSLYVHGGELLHDDTCFLTVDFYFGAKGGALASGRGGSD